MDKTAFYLELEELLELPKGALKGTQSLESVDEWDSLAVLSFIALADSKYGVMLQPKKIEGCKVVDDLALLIEEQKAT
jgi:acyl carrier protein